MTLVNYAPLVINAILLQFGYVDHNSTALLRNLDKLVPKENSI